MSRSRFGGRARIAAAAVAAVAFVVFPGRDAELLAQQDCYDRATMPQTSVVDSHLHFRPFGGAAVPFDEVTRYLQKSGVRYASVYGIGQMLPLDSGCTYYLDCPGTPVTPTMKNDFANGLDYAAADPRTKKDLALSMTFMDLTKPETIPPGIQLYDREFPGMFRWAGEVNLVKQALFPNHQQAATPANIRDWAPFMRVLRERNIPITIHSDLGNDAEPTKYLNLFEEVLHRYPHNKIIWAHMGLSKELATLDPDTHMQLVGRLLDRSPNLTLDLSWRVLEDLYFSKPGVREKYAKFFDRYPTRAITGTDFVASANKTYDIYATELEVTSRINKHLGNEAFRRIALGQNYFDLLHVPDRAPQVCGAV
jgi:hypothetical protein